MVDSLGIQKADQNVRIAVQKHVASNQIGYTSEVDEFFAENRSGVLYGISYDFLKILKGIEKNDFADFIEKLKEKKKRMKLKIYLLIIQNLLLI